MEVKSSYKQKTKHGGGINPMNSNFNSVFLSKIAITDTEITYSEKKNCATIQIKDITEFDVTEGTFAQYGHLRIVANGIEHRVDFVSTHNKGLRAFQKEIGFYNVSEPNKVTDSYEDREETVIKASRGTGKKVNRNDIIAVIYEVTGTNPKTRRKKSQLVTVSEGTSNDEIIKRSGLEEPCEIKILKDPPTSAQILYAKKLGIKIPEDATSQDVSIFITRAKNYEPIYQEKANKEILDILINKLGIYVPSYANDDELNEYYWAGMSKSEKYAYFAMRVYAENVGKKYKFLYEATDSEQEMFKNFSEKYMGNSEFENSFKCYNYFDVPLEGKIKKKLKAYQIVVEFLIKK